MLNVVESAIWPAALINVHSSAGREIGVYWLLNRRKWEFKAQDIGGVRFYMLQR
jgi:hypothetical protein